MTKHTDECREYTLPRDEKSSDPKGLDSREHQNWVRVGSRNLLPYKVNMGWKLQLSL